MPLSFIGTVGPGAAPARPREPFDPPLHADVIPPVESAPPPRSSASASLRNEQLNRQCHDWLAAIAKGDAGALEALYDATLAWLWPLARKVLGNEADVEDVLSEVYHQVWRNASKYEPSRSPPMAWLTMICRSRAIDHLRRRDGACAYEDIESLADLLGETDAGPRGGLQAGGAHDDPQHALGWAQQCRGLEAAIAALPAIERQLILLAYFRDMSQTELAQTLGMPLGTVKSRTRRALAELRRQLTLECM